MEHTIYRQQSNSSVFIRETSTPVAARQRQSADVWHTVDSRSPYLTPPQLVLEMLAQFLGLLRRVRRPRPTLLVNPCLYANGVNDLRVRLVPDSCTSGLEVSPFQITQLRATAAGVL